MTKIICDLFMYVFEALLLYDYANSLFSGKRKTAVKVLSVIGINIVLFFTYQTVNSVLNTGCLLVLYFFTIWLIFGSQPGRALFHATLFTSIMILSEIFVINLCSVIFNDFNAMSNDISAYIFVIVTSKLIYFSVMLAIKKQCSAKNYSKQKDSFYWILFLFPLICILICILIFYIADKIQLSDPISIFVSSIFIFLLFANIVIFMVYDKASKNRAELYELKAIKFRQEIDEKYFAAIEQSHKEIRYLSHDIKNHLLQIRYLEDVGEIHKYLDEVIKNVEKISYVRISSNKMLNLIISKYSAICEKKRISFSVNVDMANLSYVDDVDLSALFNNLLDNAVEAAEASEGGFIELNIFSKNSRFDGVIIRNTSVNAPKHIDTELISSKKDKIFHGLGVNIVKQTLKKYEAVYQWNYDKKNKQFEACIVFPKA